MKTILVDAVDCFVSNIGEIYKEMHELGHNIGLSDKMALLKLF